MSVRNNIPPIDKAGNVNWHAPIESFAVLSPNEIVALSRLKAEAATEFTNYLDKFISDERDPVRLMGVLGAFLDSPVPEDRQVIALATPELLIGTGYRKAGLEMWHRLIGDEDDETRDRSYESLVVNLHEAIPDRHLSEGFYAVDQVDEQQLVAQAGLTRQDAYDLTLSYAYAENGDYFNLGRAALAKLQAAQPPTA